MKTDNIQIAELGISTNVTLNGTLKDYYLGPGIKQSCKYISVRYILVKVYKDFSGELIAKDLHTNKKYSCEVPFDKGKIFIPKMISFNNLYPGAKRNLPKNEILDMGNDAIQKIIKIENDRRNK